MTVPDENLTDSYIVTAMDVTSAMLVAEQGDATMEVVVLAITAFAQDDAIELGLSAPQTRYDFLISANDARTLINALTPLATP